MSWRSHSAEVLRGLASTIRDMPSGEARKAISDAYPFGPRSICTRTSCGCRSVIGSSRTCTESQ